MGLLGLLGNIVVGEIAKATLTEIGGPRQDESPLIHQYNGTMKRLGDIIGIWDTPISANHHSDTVTVREAATEIYNVVSDVQYKQTFTNHLND